MPNEVVGGRYRLDERLGDGAMAEVWAAYDLELERRVALKVLRADADPARFEREARAVAGLAHPNICRLYESGRHGSRPFLALEFLPGGTLEHRLRAGVPLPDAETARIAGELAGGLAHAHGQGVVHRDLKPGNVLFDDEDRAKIADFGIARIGGASTLTEAGTVLGTAAYISPEQASGEPATAASDVYSFGVILYRMLVGKLPFEDGDALALAAKHVNEPPPPLASVRPDVPARLEALATAALAKRPEDRPPDGAALVAELGARRSEQHAFANARTEVMARPRSTAGRRRLVFGLAAVALLAGGGIAVAVLLTRTSSQMPLTPAQSHSRTRRPRAAKPAPVLATSTAPATARPPSQPAQTRTTSPKPTTAAGPATSQTAPAAPTTEPTLPPPTTSPPTTASTTTTEPPTTTQPGR